MEELRGDINNQIAIYQLEHQEGYDNWQNHDHDRNGWGRAGGLASPPPVILPLPMYNVFQC